MVKYNTWTQSNTKKCIPVLQMSMVGKTENCFATLKYYIWEVLSNKCNIHVADFLSNMYIHVYMQLFILINSQ